MCEKSVGGLVGGREKKKVLHENDGMVIGSIQFSLETMERLRARRRDMTEQVGMSLAGEQIN